MASGTGVAFCHHGPDPGKKSLVIETLLKLKLRPGQRPCREDEKQVCHERVFSIWSFL